MVICYIKFVLIFNMGNILALLIGEEPHRKVFFIKLDSIVTRILMLDLRIVVGILS